MKARFLCINIALTFTILFNIGCNPKVTHEEALKFYDEMIGYVADVNRIRAIVDKEIRKEQEFFHSMGSASIPKENITRIRSKTNNLHEQVGMILIKVEGTASNKYLADFKNKTFGIINAIYELTGEPYNDLIDMLTFESLNEENLDLFKEKSSNVEIAINKLTKANEEWQKAQLSFYKEFNITDEEIDEVFKKHDADSFVSR